MQDPLGHTTQFRQSKTHAGPQANVEEPLRSDGVRELMRQNSEKLPESFTYDKNLNIAGRETLFDEVPDSETHQQLLHDRVVSYPHISISRGGQ